MSDQRTGPFAHLFGPLMCDLYRKKVISFKGTFCARVGCVVGFSSFGRCQRREQKKRERERKAKSAPLFICVSLELVVIPGRGLSETSASKKESEREERIAVGC